MNRTGSATRTLSLATLALAFCVQAGCGGGTHNASTYVLVHGAFMNASVWDDVSAGLKAAGATVTTVELPGHGADTTPLASVTFDGYVAAVTSALDAATEPVVLVGHSMGGMIISQAAESRPSKIERLVYLAAYLPKDGQALLDLAMADTASHVGPALEVDMADGVAKLPMADLQDIFCADCTSSEVAKITAGYRDEALGPLATPVKLTAANWGSVPRAYIHTEQDNAISIGFQNTMVEGVMADPVSSLSSSHSPFLSHADATVSALLAD